MIIRFLQSSIGKKWIVALTGLMLLGFVTGHLVGNLQIFLAPEWINSYAKHLEDLGPLLWVIRLSMLGIIGLHIITTVQLVAENRRAKPVKYAVGGAQASSLASRTMILSGLVIVAFVAFHILHYTVRLQHPEWSEETYKLANGHMVRDVHTMMVQGFSHPGVSIFYIVSVFLLASHLSHGIASVFQTFSLNNKKLQCLIKLVGQAYAWLLFVGYASIPASIYLDHLGLIKIFH
jgi:succinate dehydrogenase / fumarate reductase cytochrome b subunit